MFKSDNILVADLNKSNPGIITGRPMQVSILYPNIRKTVYCPATKILKNEIMIYSCNERKSEF